MDIKKELENKLNQSVLIKFYDFKSTFLRIEKKPNIFILKLHKLFLESNDDIKNAIVDYCLKKDKSSRNIIKLFAYDFFSKKDYSNKLDKSKLITKGVFFDLKQIFDNLNMIYFENKLDLSITWFEKPKYFRFCHFTFGTYNRNTKLIKINKLLDQSNFPFYFINYVVYHEMLHSVCEEKNINGKRSIHTKDFKEKEKKFAYYKEAKNFEKIFLKRGRQYVRA